MHTLSDYNRRSLENYKARIDQHLQKFLEHINEGDIIQAAEKAWGIASAFANMYSIVFYGTEVKRNERKKKMLTEFLNEVKEHDVEIEELLMNEYKGHAETLVDSLASLHSFFFGGARIKDKDAERYLEHVSIILPILRQYSCILYEYYLEQSVAST